uniref:RING-type domain-containing protein n=2 Tax=Pectinophora gossypiella TaxID=13191 RepID=A0A1E1W0M9_PECGO
MVTSNKLSDKKVVKMAEQNNSAVVPQRTLLGEVNEHITCFLCHGYYIDATTIVECLHSFCRSCIIKHLQVKSYCPVCEMMINSAKPNIKLDKALQDIVYKLVPGLFQKEMERRQTFYASRPGPAASATPEQRGEDTERIIFSPEDVISFSLEYADATDTDSISSKSSDSNEPQPASTTTRRFLQCPAVVNISHLKKFLSMKFDIDSSQFAIDILYKRVPLPDYYTLMDIAYIYNWKRNEPMRFFYQIIDYIAIRNRLFDINRKGSHFRDRKSSPASTEDTNVSSPAPNLNDQGSEASSGTDSPMPEDNSSKQISDSSKKSEKSVQQSKLLNSQDTSTLNRNCPSPKKNDDEVEKSQFLNSFELTAKSNSTPSKTSPTKTESVPTAPETSSKNQTHSPKIDDTLKRKGPTPSNVPEMKKLKIELEKTKLPDSYTTGNMSLCNQSSKSMESQGKVKESDNSSKSLHAPSNNKSSSGSSGSNKEVKQHPTNLKQSPLPESPGAKKPTVPQTISSPKRKINTDAHIMQPPTTPKTVSPLKLQLPKPEAHPSIPRAVDVPKPVPKKIPDLKPSIPLPQPALSKGQPINKVRMDLLANNSDPTIDRSKILSQVKTSLGGVSSPVPTTGDPLKSLFDSCKINIPSSLSITLTDQKQDPRNPGEISTDPKKNAVNKNLAGANNASAHKVPSPPVHNYIEILKLPDAEAKKQNSKPEGSSETKSNTCNKTDTTSQSKPPNKTSESSAKGPIPNLKPIADTKLGKQSGNYSSPITFQQTFEQQLQSMQSDKKSKLPKNKAQVPKLVPANPKTFNAATKLNSPNNKPSSGIIPTLENKPSTALDLSTPTNIQSQLTPHQTKAFETMQSIANLAKKQNLPSKGLPPAMSQSFSSISNRPIPTSTPMRLPSMANIAHLKQDKVNTIGMIASSLRQELSNKANQMKTSTNPNPQILSPSYQMPSHSSPTTAQPAPRSQTRSPSSSPKLVIAEEKHTNNQESNANQSSQISSTQLPNVAPKSESPKASPGPSKSGLKPMKPIPQANKITGIRQPITPTIKPNPTLADFQLMNTHHALLRQMEMSAWIKAQRQFMTMSNIAHQAQNDFNKDKQ